MERRQRQVFEVEPEELARIDLRIVDFEHVGSESGSTEIRVVRLHDPAAGPRRDGLHRQGHVLEVGRIVRLVGVARPDERLVLPQQSARSATAMFLGFSAGYGSAMDSSDRR